MVTEVPTTDSRPLVMDENHARALAAVLNRAHGGDPAWRAEPVS